MRTIRPAKWARTSLYLTGLLIAAALLGSSRVRDATSEVWKPYSGAIHETVLPARIEPAMHAALFTEYAAQVKEVLVAAGSVVAKGQPLVVLHNHEITTQVTAAERRLSIAEARLREARSQQGREQSRLLGEERLASAARARDAARERLDAFSTEVANRALDAARGRVADLRGLSRQRLATRAELEAAVSAQDAAQRDFASAQEHASRLRQEYESAASYLRQISLEVAAASRPTMAQVESDVADARTTLDTALQRAARLQVTASEAGSVLELPIRVGEWLPSGAPVIRIADLSQLRISAPVNAVVARKIAAGDRVRVSLPTEPPRHFDATIDSVTLAPDSAEQAYFVRILVPNPDPGLILVGLSAEVRFPHAKS